MSRVHSFITSKLDPVDVDYDFSVDAWLQKTSFSFTKKCEITEAYIDRKIDVELEPDKKDPNVFNMKIFPKDECYPAFKAERTIFFPSVLVNALVAPYIKACEEKVYDLEYFIKHVPFKERAKFVADKFGHVVGKAMATDFSSWECHMSPEVLNMTVVPLIRYLLGGRAPPSVIELICRLLTNPRHVKCVYFGAEILILASGECWTAFVTALVNLYFQLLIISELIGISFQQVLLILEGDDVLAIVPHEIMITEADYASYGLKATMEVFDSVEEASFCGMVFDMESMEVLTDPIAAVAKFGWVDKAYMSSKKSKKFALMRCKALSYMVQYPACPIVSELCRQVLKITRGVDVLGYINSRHVDSYRREIYLRCLLEYETGQQKEVTHGSRLLVEKKWKIPYSTQLICEEQIRNWGLFCDSRHLRDRKMVPLYLPLLVDLCPDEWKDYWDMYVIPYANVGDIYRVFLNVTVDLDTVRA